MGNWSASVAIALFIVWEWRHQRWPLVLQAISGQVTIQ